MMRRGYICGALALCVCLVACQDRPAPAQPPAPPVTASEGAKAPADAKPAATSSRVGDPADWCGGHGLPESMCTICNPELTQKFKDAGDWCAEHNLPESACPKCNPMTPPPKKGEATGHEGHGHKPEGASRVGDPADWCGGHGLPESMCTICNPELTQKFKDAGDWCAAHNLPESACPKCNPMTPPPKKGEVKGTSGALEPGTTIKLKAPAHEAMAGITTEVVRASSSAQAPLEVIAQVAFNRNQMAQVRSPVAGIIRSVSVDLGEVVKRGQPLFELESVAVSDLQARRQGVRERVESARADLKRQEALRKEQINAQRQVELSRQELELAQSELSAIDQSLRLSGAAGGRGRFVVSAPIDGTIIAREAILGMSAEGSLAQIAQLETMWAMLELPETDAHLARLGMPITLEVAGLEGQPFDGLLTWISPAVNPRTRTVSARAEIKNPLGKLRDGQFARAKLALKPPSGVVSVPGESLQQFKSASVVFVRTAEADYRPVEVALWRREEATAWVSGSLKPGEHVVTTGAFLLRTELDRSGIGAGCCEADGPKK